MYVSPAVRSVHEHPTADSSCELLLRVEDDVDRVATRVRSAGATVERELEFETLVVRMDETDVGALFDIDGVASIETTAALQMGAGGAGEDVRPENG